MKRLIIFTTLAFLLSACGGSSSESSHKSPSSEPVQAFDNITAHDALVLISHIHVNHVRLGETDIYRINYESLRSRRSQNEDGKKVDRYFDFKVADNQDGTINISVDIVPDEDVHYQSTWSVIEALIDNPEEILDCGEARTFARSRPIDQYTDEFEKAVDYLCQGVSF